MADIKKQDAKNYINRELSWLEFNYRVLHEAKDKTIPLFERIKFLNITASNLDEFFMVRVASLKDLVHAKYEKADFAGMKPSQQLEAISQKAHDLVAAQYNVLTRSLIPLLKKSGIQPIESHEKLTKMQSDYVDKYFMEQVYPVLTPMAVDSSRPFPLIRNKSLNLASLLYDSDKKQTEFATVQVPSVLPRIIPIPLEEGEEGTAIILLEEIIEKNINKLYLSYEVLCTHPYRVMRNADLTIDEDEAEDLLKEIEKQLKKRQWGEVIRLEVEEHMDKRLLKILQRDLSVTKEDIYFIKGPLDLTFLRKLGSMDGFDHLKYPSYRPQPAVEFSTDEDIFTQIRSQDILLHHPYQSFDPVVSFIKQSAKDPNVLAIKQTLYRVSGNSPIIASLAQAAENGKQVSVLVELKARFDEENNIHWAKQLEQAGCHVIYGLVGLKTHSKITLVVRNEEDGICRYVHLGTGNYNDTTAKLYTDLGLFTCNRMIGEDATAVFNMLSGYSEPLSWNKLCLAPIWLRNRFVSLVEREIQHAKDGKPAFITIKLNSLCDKQIIDELYQASKAGVKVDLIVRGICSLRAGVEGLSENITVRSIVGNFLEHSRIYHFHNNGRDEVYLGSADLMPRNLDRRVEILFPVEKEELKRKIIHILKVQLEDTEKAHILKPDDTYEKVNRRNKELVNSQDQFCKEAIEEAAIKEKWVRDKVFLPLESI